MSRETIGRPTGVRPLTLMELVGSGDKIGLLLLPVLVIGLTANILRPAVFSVGGPPATLRAISIIALVPGVIIWIWSVILILTNARRGELITHGPYALMKHPLYTGVALLVLPWIGFLFNTWLGVLIGAVLYVGSRMYSHEEEEELCRTFGAAWDDYRRSVAVPWL